MDFTALSGKVMNNEVQDSSNGCDTIWPYILNVKQHQKLLTVEKSGQHTLLQSFHAAIFKNSFHVTN